MAILLFILTVLIVLSAQYYFLKKFKGNEPVKITARVKTESIDGVSVSRELSFHPFHTWAKKVDAQTVIVGVDDFGRRFIGPVDSVVMPLEGSNLETGQSCVRMKSTDRYSTVISPVSGEVFELNPALQENPNLVFTDPYGEGWLFKIRHWTLMDQLKNLFSGKKAVEWMERSIEILRLSIPSEVGVVAQDGGLITENLSKQLDRYTWQKLVRENLGTEAMEKSE